MSCSRALLSSACWSPGWRLGLAFSQHVAHVLGIGVEAHHGDTEIRVQYVTGLDHRVPAEAVVLEPTALNAHGRLDQVPKPRSWTRWRIHHTTSCVLVTPGVITALENAAPMIS